MKYYKDPEGNLYADPIKLEGLEEVLSPIREDGSVLPQHEQIRQLDLQEDGTRYQAYLTEPDEDGVYQPDLSALQEALIASNVTTAKELRDSTIVSDIEVLGAVWQVDDKGRGSMDLAIEYANRNSIPAETTQGWRLADNSVRECTVGDLNAVLNAYTERSIVVWAKYNAWFLTDKLVAFVV